MGLRLIINQPGRTGDILICLPIAKHYHSLGYEVFWNCPPEYHNIFRNINYVTPICGYIKTDHDCEIDLSFGIVKNTKLHQWWTDTRPSWQSFVSAKYHLTGVPLLNRWSLEWERNIDRENILYKKICPPEGIQYAVVHESTWDCAVTIDTPLPKVLFKQIDDFNIFDWYTVLLEAEEIHCIDSCLCNFVEVIPRLYDTKKFYHVTRKTPNQEDRTLLINNWRIVG